MCVFSAFSSLGLAGMQNVRLAVCYSRDAAHLLCVLQQRSGSFTSTAGKGLLCVTAETRHLDQLGQIGATCCVCVLQQRSGSFTSTAGKGIESG